MLIPMDHDYNAMEDNLVRVLRKFEILSGNVMGDSARTWQDEAGELHALLCALADRVKGAQKRGAFVVFPSAVELIEEGLEK